VLCYRSLILTLSFVAVLIHPKITLTAQRSIPQVDDRAVAEFYRGKVARIFVGFPPGGGADVYSRVIARHLGRHIPGNPTLVVVNIPGAGSIIAGNYIFNSAARDGTEIGMLNGAVVLEQLFANPGIHFDMAKFRYLAVPVNETYVMIVTRQSGIAKFSELIGANAKQAILGAIPNSTLEHAPILLREALDANVKVVSGYKGSADIRLAVDTGEVSGFFNPWSTVKYTSLDKFTSGEWSVILQLTDQPLRDLPNGNIPTIADLSKDKDQRDLAAAPVRPINSAKPPARGWATDRAAALSGFASFGDRSLADAEKAKLEITPIYGASIQRIVGEFLGMPPAIKERLSRALKK
jgi:tripartite-type tricarboxylate transporter receptor subunit TctC